MKKLALLLVFVLLFSFTACHGADGDKGGDGATTTTTAAPGPQRTDTFTVGTATGSAYENTFFGLGCRLDSGWMVDTAEQCNPFLTVPEGSDFVTAAQKAQEFFDMQAVNTAVGGMITVKVENVPLLWDTVPSLDEYVEMQRLMCDGNPDLVVKDVTATIGSLSCKGLKITVGEEQTDSFYYIPHGKYMITIGFSAEDASFAEDFLPLFYTF